MKHMAAAGTWLLVGLVGPMLWAEENPMLTELLQKGVVMSEGTAVKLPPPTLHETMDAAGQQAAIRPLTGSKFSYEDLVRNSLQTPFVLNIQTVATTKEQLPARRVDLWFVAHGSWEKLKTEDFLQGLLRSRDDKRGDAQRPSQSGILKTEQLAARKIFAQYAAPLEEKYFFSTVNLFDRVEVSSTRHSVVSRSKTSFTVAARIAPQFTNDPQFPNQWRPMELKESGEVVIGSPRLYVNSGFYVKASQLQSPVGAVLIEYHLAFEEPRAWFDGGNLLRSKLPLFVQDEVRSFRRRLAAP